MIQEKLRRNALFLILPLLAALFSFFVLAGVASSPEVHKHSIAALAYILNVLFDWRGLRLLAGKLAAFGLLIVLVIPVSLQLSNMIEDTYQASIDATIQSAQDAAEEIEDSAAEGGDEKGFWAGLLDGITHAASGAADKVGRMANDFLEALAVMLVTSCIIPILVLLSFVWLAKTLLSIQIQIPLPGQAERQSGRRTASRVEDQKPQ